MSNNGHLPYQGNCHPWIRANSKEFNIRTWRHIFDIHEKIMQKRNPCNHNSLYLQPTEVPEDSVGQAPHSPSNLIKVDYHKAMQQEKIRALGTAQKKYWGICMQLTFPSLTLTNSENWGWYASSVWYARITTVKIVASVSEAARPTPNKFQCFFVKTPKTNGDSEVLLEAPDTANGAELRKTSPVGEKSCVGWSRFSTQAIPHNCLCRLHQGTYVYTADILRGGKIFH